MEIVQQVIEWIEAHNEVLMVAITLVYVVATFLICRWNRQSALAAQKSVVEAQKSLKKSIDLQLYQQMLKIASNLEQNDYSNTTMEISVLLGIPTWKEVEQLKKLLSDLNMWENKRKKYNELCESQGYNDELDFQSNMDGASPETIKSAQEQSEKFAVLYDYESFNPECNSEPDKYDWNEISTSIKSLENEIATRQNQLKQNVYTILKSKITID